MPSTRENIEQLRKDNEQVNRNIKAIDRLTKLCNQSEHKSLERIRWRLLQVETANRLDLKELHEIGQIH